MALSGNGTVADDRAGTVPVQLNVAVVGEPVDGPAYSDAAAATSPASPTPSPAPSSSSDASPSSSPSQSVDLADATPAGSGSGLQLPVLVTLAAVLLVPLLGVAAYGVRAGRRSRASS